MTDIFKIGNRTYVYQPARQEGKRLRLAALPPKALESYLMHMVDKYQTDPGEAAAAPAPAPDIELLQRRDAALRHAVGTAIEWPPTLDEETLRSVLRRQVETDGLAPYDWATTLQQEYVAPPITAAALAEAITALQASAPPTIIVSADWISSTPTVIPAQHKIIMRPDDACLLHQKIPLILRHRISVFTGEYVVATLIDGPFPLDLPLPPYSEPGA